MKILFYLLLITGLYSCAKVNNREYTCHCEIRPRGIVEDNTITAESEYDALQQCDGREVKWITSGYPTAECYIK